MINLLNDTHELECDNCAESLVTSSENFIGAVNEAKDEGWKICEINGEWYHFCCDECKKEFKK